MVHLTDTQLVEIPAGGLGVVGASPIPPQTADPQSGRPDCRSRTAPASSQPLTQLLKVSAAYDVARAERGGYARERCAMSKTGTTLMVHQVYYRHPDRRRAAACGPRQNPGVRRSYSASELQQVRYGSALEADLIESRAHALQARQELLTTELQRR